ncbi:MAG: DPP IV N-terminal domain-containing protein, partial [Planctomycetota bacterium]|nr:DPP IV N-terminal domain-containing protein [Planctomycetota bacterium]
VSLFDHDLMAARLSELLETPIDAEAIDLSGIEFDESGNEMKFVAKGWNFTYDRTTAALEKKDKAKARSSSNRRGRGSSSRQRRGSTNDEDKREKTEKEKAEEAKKRQKRLLEQWRSALKKYEDKLEGKEDEEEEGQQGSSRSRSQPQRGHRSAFSPDLRWYVFSRQNNLYVVERNGDLQKLADVKSEEDEAKAAEADAKKSEGEVQDGDSNGKTEEQTDKKDDTEEQSTTGTTTGTGTGTGTGTEDNAEAGNGEADADSPAADEDAADDKEALRFPFDQAKALALSDDGAEDYSYGGNEEDDFGMPATVTWSPDSHGFFVSRSDSRGVAELFLVDSLGEPRPSLQQYKYPMPGEEKVRNREFMMFHADTRELIKLPSKWTDESYVDSRWLPNGELRVLRRDRTLRKLEYGIVDPKTGDFEVLFDEKLADAGINTQTIRYLDDRSQFIWWSERTGWGHYYLYDLSGKMLNPITRGRFRASRILDVDEEKGLMWFRGNGREKGESIYHEHLYRVRLDGGDLTLLDAGDANHRSSLSKSRRFVIDNCSRVDQAPTSVLRNSDGEVIMELAEADMSQLREMGWRPPDRFVVKAADGVTDLYGNMWKPFDFDPQNKYPLIVHVYPGPQTEGVTHSFSATGSRQELAQLGFIVIQVGHRGGTPTRSKAYGSYGYFNMRDYGLEDKKAAIEQLAARNAFIDIDRIGIYGHSGGGFMTAAALLKPPYHKFFKVGVSTAGNHDNNIYNSYWAERYHGLKEAKDQKAKDQKAKDGESKGTEGRSTNRRGRRRGTEGDKKDQEQKTDGDQTERKDQDKNEGGKTETSTKDKQQDSETGKDDKSEDKTRFEIKVATNAELAGNLEGKLLLVHGEIDNNVHPAGTMRLVNALIKANKRFDLLIVPGARHSFGSASNYVKHRTWEYFALHLLGDQQTGADITEKHSPR